MHSIITNNFIWKNPFNPLQKKLIKFDNLKFIILWSKYPVSLVKYSTFLKKKNLNYYLLYTLNDYPKALEPKIPNINIRIDLFKKLVDINKQKNIVWRFDPIIITDKITEEKIYNSLIFINKKLKGYFNRLIVSMITLYPKVKKRLTKQNIKFKQLTDEEKLRIYKNIGKIGKEFNIEIMSCAEKLNINNELEKYNIKKGKCIDPELIKKLFPEDTKLIQYTNELKKDTGQRKECGCIKTLDIGSYNTCKFKCLYCYAI